jgi:hypothetical protein
MDHQRHAHGLVAAAGQFRTARSGGRRQAGAKHMGKIDAGLFKYRATFQNPRASTTTFFALPAVLEKMARAVHLLEGLADGVLQFEQVVSDLCDVLLAWVGAAHWFRSRATFSRGLFFR